MASTSQQGTLTAQTTYKKQPGTLSLDRDALRWTAQGATAPSLSLPTSRMTGPLLSISPRVLTRPSHTHTS